MNIKTMRSVDKYAGILICGLLTLVNIISLALRGNPRMKKKPEDIRKIMIIKFWGIGSIILASPAIMTVRRKYPKAKIFFLTFAQNKDICESLGVIDEIISIDRSSLFNFFTQTIGAIIYCRRLRLDLAIDLEFLARFSSIMTYLSGAGKSVEFYSSILWRGSLSKIPVHYNYYFHVTENFLNLVRALGIKEETQLLLKPVIEDNAREKARQIFERLNISEGVTVIAVNINSSDMAKERRWPKENFAFLVSRLLDKYHLKIILIGGKEDKTYVDDFMKLVADHKDSVFNISGETRVKELIAILDKCSILISNDSGPLHIAEALGLPTVSFFGPETPVLYGPKGDKHLVYYRNLLCSPCMNIHNNKLVDCIMNNQCMTGIKPEEVFISIEQKYPHILDRNKL